MPRVIVKCRYYKNTPNQNLGNLMKYIASREGVEKLPIEIQNLPSTKLQNEFISSLLSHNSKLKSMDEYLVFEKEKTRGNASELISSVVEKYPDLMKEDSYLRYMGTRPRVEKINGTHGLFSSQDNLNLENEVEKLENHVGNIYSVIISLKREDAERLGYNNAERWKDMLRANIDKIAEAHKIPFTGLSWYGAFHNEKHHPHVHLLLYSNDNKESGYINKQGTNKLRHLFGTEIFKDELMNIYDRQTEVRNELTKKTRVEFAEILSQIRNGTFVDKALTQKIEELAERLKKCSGKIQYGYLPKGVKVLVNEIVDVVAQNEKIDRLYEIWYQAKCSVINTYTDNPPKRLPLSQENVFKSIRNALISEANSLNDNLNTTTRSNNKNSNTKGGKVFGAAVRFGNSVANTFRDNLKKFIPDYDENEIDKKLRLEIEQVTNGENIVF